MDTPLQNKIENQNVTQNSGIPNVEWAIETPSVPRDEDVVITMVTQYLKRWSMLINIYNFGIYGLGIISISTSLFVAGFVGATDSKMIVINPLCLKICAIASSVSLTFLTAFNVVNKSNDARRAWRTLNAAYLFFQSGDIDLKRLIVEYYTAEQIIGTVDFNFNSTQQQPLKEPLPEQPAPPTVVPANMPIKTKGKKSIRSRR